MSAWNLENELDRLVFRYLLIFVSPAFVSRCTLVMALRNCGNVITHINEVTLYRAGLVGYTGMVTAFGYFVVIFYQPLDQLMAY